MTVESSKLVREDVEPPLGPTRADPNDRHFSTEYLVSGLEGRDAWTA